MTSMKDQPGDSDALRRQAEAIAGETAASSPVDIAVPSPDDTRRLLYDLRVHQIELEMQNEELRRAQVELDAGRARYFDLYDLAPVGYCTVNDKGMILEVNLTAAGLLGQPRNTLVTLPFSRFILKEDQDSFYRLRRQCVETGASQQIDLRMARQDGTQFWAHLETVSAQDQDGASVLRVMLLDITTRKEQEHTLAFLSQCGLPVTGEDFFLSLARYIAETLDMGYVCIDRLVGDGLTAQTVAVYHNGNFESNVTYALQDTPCGAVVGETICCFPRDVRQRFPRDADLRTLQAESYIGTTLRDSHGQPIGLIAVIDRHPLSDPRRAEALLKLVAPRAAGEMERRAAELALQESEARWRSYIDHAPYAIYLADHTGRYLQVNPTACRATGYSETELLSMDIPDLLAEESRIAGMAHFQRLMDTGYAEGELRFRLKNGEARWASVLAIKLSETHYLAFTQDIHEHKLAEEALREASQLNKNIIESVQEGVIVYGRDLGYRVWNPFMERLTGVMAHELIGRHPGEVFPFLREVGVIKRLEDASAGIPTETIDFPYPVPATGQMGWVRDTCIPMRDADGAIIGVIATMNEITERKQAEQLLRESEERFRGLFENELNGVALHEMIFDPEGNPIDFIYLQANPAFEKHTGMCPADILGKRATDIVPGIEQSGLIQIYGKVALTGEPTSFELYFAPLRRHFSIRAYQVGPGCFAAVFDDISERKLAEEAHDKLQEQLRQAQKMESVGRLAGGVAHDFNNMLGVILGYTDFAMMQLDADSPIQGDLIEIKRAAQRSANLTRQLLAFARKQTVAPQVLDLNETIVGTYKMLRHLIGENIDLIRQPGADLWPVHIDPTQVDQILTNLCINAHDAIADVGTITIATHNVTYTEPHGIDDPDVTPGDYVMLTISDTGCGMDADTMTHLFEPFFTTKDVGEGTGLGLATVYGVVKQNHGFIAVSSERGQGTTFNIHFPRHLGAAERLVRDGLAVPFVRGQETILLVEDEQAILRLAKRVLEQQGFQVLTAATPGEALLIADAHAEDIDMLVTDVIMPEMNGRDLATRLQERSPRLRVLFMSGYTADVIAQHGVLQEGTHFLQKPFALHDLLATVRKVLDQN